MQRIIALLLLIIFSPILIIVALLIFFEDGFPVLFKQKRVGLNCTYFTMYKFRSMRKDTPDVATHLLDNPTKYLLNIGKLLRKISLDELPNLINILKGDMGFVGPRPALYNQDDLMRLRINSGVEKLLPGLTGWAQIKFRYGRSLMDSHEKFEYDLYYLKNRNLFVDFGVLLKTFQLFFKKE